MFAGDDTQGNTLLNIPIAKRYGEVYDRTLLTFTRKDRVWVSSFG